MKKVQFKDIELTGLGTDLTIGGVVYSGKGKNYVCLMDNDSDINDEFSVICLNTEEWKKVIQQTDFMETEILQKDSTGAVVKTIIRKSTRIIEQGISWRVYKRDNYKCRYCGKDDLPLTVDHLVLWEVGGPSIEENLVSACKKCNKTRSNTPYEQWLEHPYYKKVSQNISQDVRAKNSQLVSTLTNIPLRAHVRSR